jgi:DNA primase
MTDLEEIKNRLDVVDVISEYVSLKKAGQNWKGLCPFHAEKTPSFTVSPAKQIYYCFGCSSGGDIFTFLMKYEDLSFQESLSSLAKKAGVQLKRSPGDKAVSGVKETMLEAHKEAAAFYMDTLRRTSKAAGYLEKRGLKDEVLKRFSVGYAPQGWNALFSYLRKKRFRPELVKKSGLAGQGSKGYYDTFRNRIMFPILDLRGNVIAFGGRVLDSSEPKYLNSPETSIFSKGRTLYGLHHAKDSIKKTGCAVFVEGYLDVIAMHMHGFSNAVAPLGTALTPDHGRLIKRFTDEAVIVFDGDESGLKAAGNGISVLLESGLDVKVLVMPGGEDPDSFLKKEGADSFSPLLEKALSVVEFYMHRHETGGSGRKNERAITGEALEAIAKIPDSALQGYYVKLLSEGLNINELFIREQLMRIRGKGRLKGGRTGLKEEKGRADGGDRPLDELYLLRLVLQLPDKAEKVFNDLTEEHFEDPLIRSIFKKMKSGMLSYDSLAPECTEEEKNLLAGLLIKIEFEDPDKVFEDCLKRLKSRRHQAMLYELQHRIKKAEMQKNDSLLRTLLMEQQKHLKTRV